MSPRQKKIVAAALVAVVSSTAIAGVIRGRTGNPDVTAGGKSFLAPPIPYGFMGALGPCEVSPWECLWVGQAQPQWQRQAQWQTQWEWQWQRRSTTGLAPHHHDQPNPSY
jgi:hypothetical protein